MNFEDAFDYFAKKGTSFYISEDLAEVLKGKKFDPLSKFGIGVLSSFIISDKMIVESKKTNCAPCRFIISDLAEGWIYEEGSRKKSGTKITLFLNSLGKEIDPEAALRHYAKNIEIPIFIKNPITEKKRPFLQKWDYKMSEVVEKCSEDARESFPESKPILTLCTKDSGLEVTYYAFEKSFLNTGKNCFLLTNGVYVGNFEFFPNAKSNWIALINCKSNLVDLKVSREDVVQNKKYENFLSILYHTFCEALDAYACKQAGGSGSSLVQCAKFSVLIKNFFQSFLGVKKDKLESLWLFQVYNKKTYPIFFNNKLTFLRGDQIKSQNLSKIIHYKLTLESYKEHIEVICEKIANTLDDNEALVFDLEPHFTFLQTQPRFFFCAFCEIFNINGTKSIICSNLSRFISTQSFTRISTPIDPLLPTGSFFTKMPEQFRGLTAQLKFFEFTPSPEDLGTSEIIRAILYHKLTAKELFP